MRIGVDEAGKGPVLGSMFAAAVRGPTAALPDDVDDSKRLSAERREAIADRLRCDDRVTIGLAEVTPTRIDAGDATMNDLTVAAHVEALAAVVAVGDDCCCDAGDVDADRFARRVAAGLDCDVALRADHGADGDDAHVAAASVIAKSAREAHVAALAGEYGTVGSGYPSDPTTREFLREYVAAHGDLPGCARRSWQTCDDVLAAAAQTGLDEF